MRGLVQRVGRAEVRSRTSADDPFELAGAIGPGLCVFVGVTHDDTPDHADRLAAKLWGLRILDDRDGVMNRSLSDTAAARQSAEVLVVSQFTLYADTRKGRRPSFTGSAPPEIASARFAEVVGLFEATGLRVETGRFGEMMDVSLVNDGPVTIWLDSADRKA